MFRQIEQAYRVLADAAQRQEYDRGGAPRAPDPPAEATVSFSGFDFSAPAEGPYAATFSELFADVFQEAARELVTPTRGASIDVTLALSFEDAVRGGRFPIRHAPGARPTCRRYASRLATPRPVCRGRHETMGARPHGVHERASAVTAAAR
jgi:DnaJ-class molecular chaperone